MHIPMRDDFVSAHAHATAQRALDIPAALRKKLIHTGDFTLPILCKSGKKIYTNFHSKIKGAQLRTVHYNKCGTFHTFLIYGPV